MQIWRKKHKKFGMVLMCSCSPHKKLLNQKSQDRFRIVLDKTDSALILFYKLNSISKITYQISKYFVFVTIIGPAK